jgi:hypothetical protein
MFEHLAKHLPKGLTIFDFHPLQLRAYLEVMWDVWRAVAGLVQTVEEPPAPLLDDRELTVPPTPTVDGLHGVNLDNRELEAPLARLLEVLGTAGDKSNPRRGPVFREAVRAVVGELLPIGSPLPSVSVRPWQHLMYAYLIENTRVFEIAEAVLRELMFGERLGPVVNPTTHRWVRATEELFYQPAQGFVGVTSSLLRPDTGAVRRNAYHRMFGIDLNHGRADGQPYAFVKAEAHNAAFVATLEEVLRELWRGYINRRNLQSSNVTDLGALGELLSRLRAMLRDRRQKAVRALAREEFAAVAMASWFKVLLASDNDVVTDLRATASTEEERLRRIGERVGLAPHSRARSLLQLADQPFRGGRDPQVGALPAFLLEIEDGRYENNDPAVQSLFDDDLDKPRTERTLNILTHWSNATGHDLKSLPVTAR